MTESPLAVQQIGGAPEAGSSFPARPGSPPASRTRLGGGAGQVRTFYTDFGAVTHRLIKAAGMRGKPDAALPPLPPLPTQPPTAPIELPPAAVEVGPPTRIPSRRNWPRHCGAAFQGVLGEVADLTGRYTEADPHGVVVALLVGVGNEVGRGPHVVLGGRPHYANLFAALVGGTARGRKGTATSVAMDILGRASERGVDRRVRNGLSTGEGLIARIRDKSVRVTRKIVNGQEKVTVTEEPGIKDKRVLFVESEGGRLFNRLRNPLGTLGPVLSAAFDGEDLTIATKTDPKRASRPHVSVAVNVTRELLTKTFPELEIESGLANRVLWVLVDRPRIDADGGRVPDADLDRCATVVREAIAWASTVGEVPLSPDAAALWRQQYERLDREQPGRYGQVTARAAVLVRRLALIYAILAKSSVVATDHLRAALDLWQYCDESARLLFGDELGNSRARRIYEALLEAPEGMSQEQIRQRVFSKHLRSCDLQDSLRELLSFRMVEVVRKPTGGRTATVVRAVPLPSDEDNLSDIVL